MAASLNLKLWPSPVRLAAVPAVALAGLLPEAGASEPEPGAVSPPATIAFGSCAKENAEQPIWGAVAATEPGLFIFLGDTIYGDTGDMQVLREKYRKLDAVPGFRAFRSGCRVVGTWDDHDYGINDAGVEFPQKRESQQVFLDFYRVPEDSPRRRRDGVYDSFVLGSSEAGRCQVVLLDTRYFRSPLTRVPDSDRAANLGPYTASREPGATVLGEAQWAWLEEQLAVPADLRVIATSIQAIPDGHGWEKWANFPEERARLFEAIRSTGANGVVLISGDRHLGEISLVPPGEPELGVGYPLFEVTSSGLTQSGGGSAGEPNRHRVAPATPFRRANFGVISVDWGSPAPEMVLQIRDVSGDVVAEAAVPLGSLKAG